MKTIRKYITPAIEVIKLQTEDVIASSLRISDERVDGEIAGSRRRDFWE